MKFIAQALAFVCLVQIVFGAPTQANNNEPSSLDGLSGFLNSFQSMFGEDGVNNIKNSVNELSAFMNKTMSESEIKKAMQNFQQTISGHVEAVKKANPEAAASAQKLEESLKVAVDKVLENGKKLSESSKGVMDDLAKAAKETFDKGVSAAKEMQEKIEKQLEKKN